MYPPQQQGIAVTTKFFPLSWIFVMVKPKIFVNGYEMPVLGWGRTVLALAPGQYLVHVFTPYFLPSRVGPADFTVAVPPGQLAELEYRAPVWTFSRGSLGPPPQRYNGLAFMVGITVVAILVIVVSMAVIVLAASA